MPKLPKNNGLRLFNKCAKQVKKEFEKQGRPEKWNEIQKWTSANVYPKFKGKSVNQVKVADIKKEVELALGLTAPKKVSPCFSVFAVNKADIISLEWWEIENTLQGLPQNVQVRVNGGSEFGRTRIDQVQNINIEIEVQPIVENIRQFVDNKSGLVFEGIIKVVPNKKDDGSNCSYFIDFVLSDGTKLLDEEGQVAQEREVPVEDTGRVERIKKVQSKKKQTKRERLKKAKTQKRPTKSKKETVKKPTRQRTPLADKNRAKEILLEEFKLGLKTKAEYRKAVKEIEEMFDEGGII
jgi:hypothetical protein|tara:strand:+ start:642 stop:1526 length:885 start_codon:yes stop_codon:yes gene_type:complete